MTLQRPIVQSDTLLPTIDRPIGQQATKMQDAPTRTFFGSIATLVIAGFVLTALPLIVALVVGSVQVNHLTRQSVRTILQSAHATSASEFIADELVSMERNARQYAVLDDPSLLKLYQERYVQLLATLQQLEGINAGSSNHDELQAIRKGTTSITRAIEQKPMKPGQVQAALGQFNQLRQYAADLRRTSDAAMDRELEALTARSANVQRALLWQSVLLGLFGLVLAAAFIAAILRPIRQINQTIARLGAERFDEPVHVDGPRDLRGIGERLDWLRERLQQVEQQKNEFVRHMSHELKTPLANIRESTSLLLDNTVGRLSEGQRDIVSILDSSGRRLHLLVDNLINLARWREQRTVTVSHFEFIALVRNQLKEHRLLMERKFLQLDLVEPEAIWISADNERIKTLFANLLSNAIKYSPEYGTIHIKVCDQAGTLVLEIKDEGPGIPAEDTERVFEPFFQSANTAHIEGTGIGLSLVRECILAHGGSGEFLDSETGAHFRADLPVMENEFSHV